MRFNKKRASLQYNLIFLVLFLIASAAAIFYFLSQIANTGDTNKELCHNSIVARSAATIGDLQFRDKLNLNCITERVCLTSNKKNGCEESLGKDSQESPIKSIKVNNKDELLKNLIEILYEDNNMVGKGLLNPMPREFFKIKKTNYCLISSKISLDPKLKEELGQINGLELYNYLVNEKDENGVSYMKLIYGAEKLDDKNIKTFAGTTFDLKNQDYVIIEIFASKSYLGSIGWGSSAGIATAIGLSWLTGGASLGILLFSGVVGGATTYATLDDPDNTESYTYIPPTLHPYNAKYISEKLKCDYIETISY